MPRLSREESQKRTRVRWLKSAQEIFARNGFAGASIDQIAEHAGYSKGAVYSNFESKEALFLELLKEHMSQELVELRGLLDRSRSTHETLSALKDKYRTMEIATSLMGMTHGIALQLAADPKSVAASTAGRAIEMFLSAVLGLAGKTGRRPK